MFESLKRGVSNKMVTILSSMYTTVRSCVRLLSNTSEFFDISIGVKQGDFVSPILFILFLNDMHKEMSKNNNALRIC